MFLYEYGDNIDNKRYYYEVYLDETSKGFFEIRVELVFRAIKPFSTTIINIDRDDVIKMLDKRIEKIVEKHYEAHINYKGEADPRLLEDV